MAKHRVIIFAPIIALATLIAVSLLLNGMLMMWKIQQAKQDDVIRATLLPCCFLPGNRGEVFIWQYVPARLLRSGWKNRDLWNGASLPPHMNTSEILDLDWALVKRPLDGKLTSFCVNPLSPKIHIQILRTDLHAFLFKNS